MDFANHPLHDIDRRLKRIEARFLEIITSPQFELEDAMSLLTDIQGIRADVQAVTAALPADVATAVAAQKATDDAANAATIQELADVQTEVTGLQADVAALKTAAGIPATPPAALSVTPATVSFSIATGASSTPLTITGGTAPLSASGLPEGVLFDGANENFSPDGNTVAGTSTVTFTDSSSPPLTATQTVVIA